MAEPSLLFPAEEYARRTAALQSRMAGAGLPTLLLTSPADIFYTTGFLTRFWESPARPWFVVVPATGKPIAVIPAIGAALMAQTWINDTRTWDAPDPADDGVSLLSDTLAEVAGEGPIGTPMGLETSLRMPLADFETLRQSHTFTDATEIVQRVREVKSEAEIAKIRDTCVIADRAFARLPRIIAEAPRLDAVFRQFQSVLLDEGADWVSYLAGGSGPGGYGDVISPATDAPLQTGDVVMLDTGAVKDGYFCDFDRNVSIGPPDAATAQTQEALWQATETVLTELRPGMRASDVHALLTTALTRHGATPCAGRLGHGLGVTLTEWPSFTAKDHTVLQENMVLTLEPSAEVTPGRILVHEENIVLRADGPELLSTRAPRAMPEVTL